MRSKTAGKPYKGQMNHPECLLKEVVVVKCSFLASTEKKKKSKYDYKIANLPNLSVADK